MTATKGGDHPPRRKLALGILLLGACLGVFACVGAGRLFQILVNKLLGVQRDEVARTTSPDGQFDAVMVQELYGGAAGGINWYVFITSRAEAPRRSAKPVFSAGSLTGEKLIWNQPHLLTIHYEHASVDDFRNLWAAHEVGALGSSEEREFLVEIRLDPSSEFSVLTSNGDFQPHQP